ncbi:hypothetical protein GOBAR_AA31541 [Gossypium barbadense]|uniref:Uncharacterized protein n=1 Tax=Gossypium barbadense TaxID=3634 RepID=A0A2P5WDI4_GOSBA|nr:hypothetical protein GOBAR_AA31541 [Gossypium barbadense]
MTSGVGIEKIGEYSVKSAYCLAFDKFADSLVNRVEGPWLPLWNADIPPKVEDIDHVILGCTFAVQVCSLSTIVVPSSSFSERLFSLLLGVDTALFGRVVAWSLWYFHNQFLGYADTSTVASAFAASFGQDWPVARSTYQQVRPATAQAVAAPLLAGLGHKLAASSVTSTLLLAKTCSKPAMDWLLGTKEVLSYVKSLTLP